MKDWIMELCPEIAEWQAEIIAEQVRIRVESEREAIAQSMDKQADLAPDDIDRQWAQEIAAAIRARGEK